MKGRVDIGSEQRKAILSLLSSFIPNIEVWAYGSRVKGTTRHSSDLDLVVFAALEQRRRIPELEEAFEESSLPCRVDVMIWDEMSENFSQKDNAKLRLLQKPVTAP